MEIYFILARLFFLFEFIPNQLLGVQTHLEQIIDIFIF